MDAFEVRDALAGFRVIVDTREQMTQKARERFGSLNAPVERATMSYGDYCADVPVNGRQSLYDGNGAICAPCVIERKMSLDELAGCFTRGRDRFRREFERASANNAKVYLLIENGSWEGILRHRYKSRFNPEAFKASLTAWMIRYNFVPVFCRAETSGMVIKEILFRDMKERLERGEYG